MLGTTSASLTARVGITIVSQIHVANLIADELGMPRDLGKPSQPAAAPEAEHP